MNYEAEFDIPLEDFTETDIEILEFNTEDVESIESEIEGGSNLDQVNVEYVAQSLMGNFQANGSAQPFRSIPSSSPSIPVHKQLLKTFTIIIKNVVKKIMSNPRTRTKLQAAIRQGPDAVTQLLLPSVARVLPSYFRWLAAMYVPPVVRVLFNPIRTQAGVKLEEVEGLEILGF